MRLKHFLSVFLTLLTLSVGQMWGTEGDVAYTLQMSDYASGTKQSAYAQSSDLVFGTSPNQKTWNIPGNATLGDYFAVGGTSLSNTNRTITGKSTITNIIKEVKVNYSGVTNGKSSSLTLSAAKLEVSNNSDFSNSHIIETVNKSSLNITSSSSASYISFTPSSNNWASGNYYRLTFTCTTTGSKNCHFDITSIEFIEGASAAPAIVAVTGVSLNKNSTSIVENQTETLTATVSPNDATNKTVNWSTSDASVATVSGGVVTAKAVGTATITATSAADGTKSASCTVTVTAAPKDHFIDEVQGSSVADKTSAYDISTVTIADKSVATSGSCEVQHYHFVGWITKAKYDAGTAISNSDIQTGNKTPNNSTYYAVWAKGSGGNYTESVSWDSRYNTTTEVEGSELTIEENVTVTHNKGTNSTTCKFYTTGPGIRVYGGGNFVVTAPSALSSITLTFGSGEGSNAITANVGTYSNGSWTGNATSVTFSVGGINGHRRIASISATYGSVSYTDYIAKCCTPLGSINGSFFWPTLFSYLTC